MGTTEVWTVATKTGVRYYHFSYAACRAMPVARAKAELMLATGAAVLIAKPYVAGGEA